MIDQIIIDQMVFEKMIDSEQIKERIREIANGINATYMGRMPLFLCILNGSFMFMADLFKEVKIRCEVSFTKLQSYEGTDRGDLKELIGIEVDVKGRDIILVEDVVDSGSTVKYMLDLLDKLDVRSVSVCTLLLKPKALVHHIENIQYVGFEIDNEFVIGYGLDYNGMYRNLKHIYRRKIK